MFFISVPKTIECVLCAVIFAVFYTGCFYKLFGILQSWGYSCTRFAVWSVKRNNVLWGRHLLLAIMCALV